MSETPREYEPEPKSNLPFEPIPDQKTAHQNYWQNPINIPDQQCRLEIEAGTIVVHKKVLVRIKEPISIFIEARSENNADNQRQATSVNGRKHKIWIKGQQFRIKQ